jgi:hypothetical protein
LKPRTKTILLTAVLGIIWAGAIAVGLRVLLNYETSPGRVGTVPVSWPVESTIPLAKDSPTLVMVAHPQCPCTRASMDELAQVIARVQNKARVYVLFYTPTGSGNDWENTGLRRTAEKIPGVTVLSDVDGVEARRFGAETSGHIFLFDRAGRLLFSGGITTSRGHSGDNAGESSTVSLINNGASGRPNTLVFGCSLTDRKKQYTCLK